MMRIDIALAPSLTLPLEGGGDSISGLEILQRYPSPYPLPQGKGVKKESGARLSVTCEMRKEKSNPLSQGKGVKKESSACLSVTCEMRKEKSNPLPLREGVGGGVIVGLGGGPISEAAR